MSLIVLTIVAVFVAVAAATLALALGTNIFAERKGPPKTRDAAPRASAPPPKRQPPRSDFEQGAAPFLPQYLVDLFFRPGRFFSAPLALGKMPYMIFATWCYGIVRALERAGHESARAGGASSASGWGLLGPAADSWLGLWIWTLGAGAVSGLLLWWIGGWWYGVRLRWSGAAHVNDRAARLLFVYSAFVEAGPAIALALFWTAAQADYRQALAAGGLYSPAWLVFPFWSLVVSYAGARTLFDVDAWKARLWFLALPAVFYAFAFGLGRVLTAIFQP